ncbi:hypothetical protein MKZ38_003269 [Zalerion maritima]|uniref:Uncharacterized protein n=1 Tax=Zalerion maritima TaxID=339359 RepID=A0AAD5RP78_9PEZI|nr:hypothetical protein MKZ38_003269 [Zalerion maritima]
MAAAPPKGSKSKSKAAGSSGSLRTLSLGSRHRGPPPALFLHPSPQASHASIPGIHGSSTGGGVASSAPSTTTTTTAPPASTVATTNTGHSAGATKAAREATTSPTAAAPGGNPRRTGPGFIVPSIHNTPSVSSLGSIPLRSARSTDRTDALWAEMQATLEEVEFSATGSTHVFRAEHEKKLSELRSAQIALAQAWARSEADEDPKNPGPVGSMDGMGGDQVRNLKGAMGSEAGDDVAEEAVDANSALRPSSSGMGQGAPTVERMGRMEEETEVDILRAKKRREANDLYFRRVNQGVIDVVSKLADVADAMRKVEAESKDIWGENENTSGNGK